MYIGIGTFILILLFFPEVALILGVIYVLINYTELALSGLGIIILLYIAINLIKISGELFTEIFNSIKSFYMRLGSRSKKIINVLMGNSCKGPENYICNFRATDNALESIGWGHSDLCLLLDEFGQLDPFKAKDTIYLLGNGSTKARSSKNGEANERKSFSITYLSTAEVGLKNVLAQTTQRAKAGLEVRFVDIDAEVSSNGCFENLHGFKNGKELADYIKAQTKTTYGGLFDSFIKKLVAEIQNNEVEMKARLENWQQEFIKNAPVSNNEVTNRIISSLGLNYAALNFAFDHGLLNINKSNAITCLLKIAAAIVEKFGPVHSEERMIVEEIRDFILANQRSRFESDFSPDLKVYNRVGFTKQIHGRDYFCVFGSALTKDICPSSSLKQIGMALEKFGYISRNSENRFSHVIPFNQENLRAYPISTQILEFDD